MDYFTADWHLYHENIIRFCTRPFKDINHMNRTILDNVNEVVLPDDRLFNLGDVALKNVNWTSIRASIVCKNVFVVPGNHDRESQLKEHFSILPQCYMYESGGFRLVLAHYAMRIWAHSHHGAGHLYGHSHGKLPPIPGAMAFDIGVDCWNFKPLSLNQVKAEMKRLAATGPKYVVDHHGAEEE